MHIDSVIRAELQVEFEEQNFGAKRAGAVIICPRPSASCNTQITTIRRNKG